MIICEHIHYGTVPNSLCVLETLSKKIPSIFAGLSSFQVAICYCATLTQGWRPHSTWNTAQLCRCVPKLSTSSIYNYVAFIVCKTRLNIFVNAVLLRWSRSPFRWSWRKALYFNGLPRLKFTTLKFSKFMSLVGKSVKSKLFSWFTAVYFQ